MKTDTITKNKAKHIAFRFKADALDALSALAIATGLSKTEVMRRLLLNAVADPRLGGLILQISEVKTNVPPS